LRLALVAAVAGVALFTGGYAAAASKTLRDDPRLDAVASGIAGFPVAVVGEDDPAEWAQLVASDNVNCSDCANVLGFSRPLASPGDPLYHEVFIGPSGWTTLEAIENNGVASVGAPAAAPAIMDLAHETFHLKLSSTDEGRVNACALQAFPDVISTYFGVTPTVEQTTTTTTTVRVRHVYYVRVHGRRVRRVRLVPKTVTRTSTTEAPNPTYIGLVAAAQAFYASQPPPYSTGVCS
jgi:hypothetical protein